MSNPPPGSSTPPPPPPSKGGGSHVFQAPTGTRDFYPAELNRLRFIQDAWRRTSINHGFEEIDGPTFEHLDLYTVKSGEGIVSELFSFERFGGEKTFALRPEFTPTLARLYASKAASLPRPTKWFWTQNCFRAERPQRGRLREFYQWNCDIIGDPTPEADAEIIACCIDALAALGLDHEDVRFRVSSRPVMTQMLERLAVHEDLIPSVLNIVDRHGKVPREDFCKALAGLGLAKATVEGIDALFSMSLSPQQEFLSKAIEKHHDVGDPFLQTLRILKSWGLGDWFQIDMKIVRGLAYYTGMVFEVHEASGAERAIAGGGRYDKLIEMFGGPPTPAVGFGMGDVVLSLVLADKGLMPKDEEIAARLGLRPDALVISNGTPEADGAVAKVVADLRRAGLHARRSYKTTKNIGKLIQDGAKMRARYCVILESAAGAKLKNLETQEQSDCAVEELVGRLKR